MSVMLRPSSSATISIVNEVPLFFSEVEWGDYRKLQPNRRSSLLKTIVARGLQGRHAYKDWSRAKRQRFFRLALAWFRTHLSRPHNAYNPLFEREVAFEGIDSEVRYLNPWTALYHALVGIPEAKAFRPYPLNLKLVRQRLARGVFMVVAFDLTDPEEGLLTIRNTPVADKEALRSHRNTKRVLPPASPLSNRPSIQPCAPNA